MHQYHPYDRGEGASKLIFTVDVSNDNIFFHVFLPGESKTYIIDSFHLSIQGILKPQTLASQI